MKYQCFVKAIETSETSGVTRGIKWVTAKRAHLKVFEDRLECGKLKIPFTSITNTQAYIISQWGITSRVLQVTTKEKNYQFGINSWSNPIKHIPFKVPESPVKMKFSKYSIFVRVIFVVTVIYLAFRQ